MAGKQIFTTTLLNIYKKHKRYTVFLFMILGSNVTSAQEDSCRSSLYGFIRDEHDGSALDHATIYIRELNRSAIADAEGKYVVENICDGKYTIDIRHIGCEPVEAVIEVRGATEKNFSAEHHTEDLIAFELVTEKERRQLMITDSLSPRQMQAAFGNDLGSMMTSVPGVTTLQTGSTISKPMLHGMTGNRLSIINQGVKQEGQQWGTEHAPEIDPATAGDIYVAKGASAFRYGPGSADGVLVLKAAELPDSAGLGGKISSAFFSNGQKLVTSALLEGGFGKSLTPLSWRLQGSLKSAGNVRSPEYFQNNTGTEEMNFSYALQWRTRSLRASVYYSQFNATIGILSWSHTGNLTDLQNIIQSDVPPEETYFTREVSRPFQKAEHETFRADAMITAWKKNELSVVFSRQYDRRAEYDSHGGSDASHDDETPELELELVTFAADLYWEGRHGKLFRTAIGTGLTTQENTGEGMYLIPNFRNRGGNAFVTEHFQKGKWEAETGLRADAFRQEVFGQNGNTASTEASYRRREFTGMSGTAALSRSFGEGLKLTYTGGPSWRPPAINEQYSYGLHHGAAAVEYGDSILLSERVFTNSVSADFRLAEVLNADFSLYYNLAKDFIYLAPQFPPTLTIRGAFPTFAYSQSAATISGTDIRISYRPVGRLELELKSSVLRARNSETSEWIDMMPSDRAELGLTWNFRDGRKMKEMYVTARCKAVAKQYRTSGNTDYAPPPDAYFLAGLEAGTDIRTGRQYLTLVLAVENLLNHTYRDYMDRFRYYSDAMGRNVSVRLQIPFHLDYSKSEP